MARSSNIPFRFRTAPLALGFLIAVLVAVIPCAVAGETGTDQETSYIIASQGSSATHRLELDGYVAQVYLYAGGSFAKGTHLVSFNLVFDVAGPNPSGYVTPVLFEQTSPGIYTVRGIGKGFAVQKSPSPQSIPFTIVQGTKVPRNGNFTFGFINAIVDPVGIPVLTSAGAVDYDPTSDGGSGIGRGTSNNWLATGATGDNPTVVALGTTFGISNADFLFFSPFRTYSAFALGVVVVP